MNTNTLGRDGMTAQLLALLLLLGGCSVSTDNGPDCRYNEAWLAGECSVEFAETLALEFDPVYDRDASLETIAGNYRTLAENVLSIAPDGLLFLQDATSGCVVNGQVTVITATSNLYNVVLQYDGCTGTDERLIGSRFDGYAQLDDSAAPEALVIAVIGGVGDLLAATFERAVRL